MPVRPKHRRILLRAGGLGRKQEQYQQVTGAHIRNLRRAAAKCTLLAMFRRLCLALTWETVKSIFAAYRVKQAG
jgi:hypothetical protein